MKTFAYTAKDNNGKVIKGTMQVESSAVLLEKLQSSDLICTEYHETKASDIKKGANEVIKKYGLQIQYAKTLR